MNTPENPSAPLGLLTFHETYFERLWGGNKLHTLLGKRTPPGETIGEAWLVSDHPNCESVVAHGAHAGKTLRDLMRQYPRELLGKKARSTPQGRFPLLLKLLDSGQALSVQVHPDDETARALKEPDVGKTEMWHVMGADAGSTLICGLDSALDEARCASAIREGIIEQHMHRVEARPGVSVFVPAGTVHAIGGGILLAEIQQNSDLTYRLHDWGRLDTTGNPRPLHIDKALRAIHFGSPHSGAVRPLCYPKNGGECTVHAACRHFAAERLTFNDQMSLILNGDSFHLFLGIDGTAQIRLGDETAGLPEGRAALIPGNATQADLAGPGVLMHYYVPDIARDVAEPLQRAGHSPEAISRLCGMQETA